MNTKGLCGFLVLGLSSFMLGQDSAQQPMAGRADNTRVNQRDRNGDPTADQQKNGRSDVAITKEIRRSISQDKSISGYARNVKVITQSGQVTLKGPVRSEEEKKAIESKAAEVAGADKVTNSLEVQPNK
jgi:hyperosmotically inducible periplasmic protein